MTKFGEWQNAGEGIRRKIFEPGQHLMSMVIRFQAGSSGAAHSHPHEQITFVISGKLALTVNGETHIIGPEEQLYVPGGAVHSVEALEDAVVLEVFTPLREDLLATVTER
ncbi:cupin domain-containing protein [Paenibacillus thermotolerans]|uniref:cupin domain-containing protein n=1 Tax=Paenibacillus thermotolerans TaxID=3027807 RepID=UPI0023679F35|nr:MULTISPECIES: cupin domain-containing protein [unclassified Paenibacillus]